MNQEQGLLNLIDEYMRRFGGLPFAVPIDDKKYMIPPPAGAAGTTLVLLVEEKRPHPETNTPRHGVAPVGVAQSLAVDDLRKLLIQHPTQVFVSGETFGGRRHGGLLLKAGVIYPAPFVEQSLRVAELLQPGHRCRSLVEAVDTVDGHTFIAVKSSSKAWSCQQPTHQLAQKCSSAGPKSSVGRIGSSPSCRSGAVNSGRGLPKSGEDTAWGGWKVRLLVGIAQRHVLVVRAQDQVPKRVAEVLDDFFRGPDRLAPCVGDLELDVVLSGISKFMGKTGALDLFRPVPHRPGLVECHVLVDLDGGSDCQSLTLGDFGVASRVDDGARRSFLAGATCHRHQHLAAPTSRCRWQGMTPFCNVTLNFFLPIVFTV